MSAIYGFLRSLSPSLGGFLGSVGTALLSAIESLPVVSTISKLFVTICSLIYGQTNFADERKRIPITLAQGMLSAGFDVAALDGMPFPALPDICRSLRNLRHVYCPPAFQFTYV